MSCSCLVPGLTNDDQHQNLTVSFCFNGQYPLYVAAVVNPSEALRPDSVRVQRCVSVCVLTGAPGCGTPFGFVSTAAFFPSLVCAQLAVPVPSVDGWVTGPASSILPKLFGEGLAGLPAAKLGADVQAIVWWFVVRVCVSRPVKSLFPSCTTRVWVF